MDIPSSYAALALPVYYTCATAGGDEGSERKSSSGKGAAAKLPDFGTAPCCFVPVQAQAKLLGCGLDPVDLWAICCQPLS